MTYVVNSSASTTRAPRARLRVMSTAITSARGTAMTTKAPAKTAVLVSARMNDASRKIVA